MKNHTKSPKTGKSYPNRNPTQIGRFTAAINAIAAIRPR